MRYLLLIIITFLLVGKTGFSQESEKRKLRLPIWTFHDKNVSIYGISVGAFSWTGNNRNTITNGLRIEVPGIGFLTLLANGSPMSHIDTITKGIKRQDFEFSEIVNGINISSGSWGELNYNGLTLALAGQNGFLTNGVAIAGLWNSINKVNGVSIGGILLNETLHHNGIQIGGIANAAIIMKGLQIGIMNGAKSMDGIQIGLFNKTFKSKGLQIGLWNINEHRKLPILNWSFKKEKVR